MRRVTEYTFGNEGERDPIRVVYRGTDLYAVMRGVFCLSSSGRWDHEPLPSSRTSSWLKNHRFTEDVALELAAGLAS